MITLESFTEEGRKYFFEGFKFREESIEKGHAHPDAKGKVISSLEISLDSDDYIFDNNFRDIVEDCCDPIFLNQGMKACMNYITSCGWIETHRTMYIHTIQE